MPKGAAALALERDSLAHLVAILEGALERLPTRSTTHKDGVVIKVEEGIQVGEPFLRHDIQQLRLSFYQLMSNQLEPGSLVAEPCAVQYVPFTFPFEHVWHVDTWPPPPPRSEPIQGYLFAPNISLGAVSLPFTVVLNEVSAHGFSLVLVRAPWHKGEVPDVHEVRWCAYGRTADEDFPYHRRLIARALQLLVESDYALTRLVSALAAEAFLAELIEQEMVRLNCPQHEIRNATETSLQPKLKRVRGYQPEQYRVVQAAGVISQYVSDVGEARDMLGHGIRVHDMESARLAVSAIKAAAELILAFLPPGGVA